MYGTVYVETWNTSSEIDFDNIGWERRQPVSADIAGQRPIF